MADAFKEQNVGKLYNIRIFDGQIAEVLQGCRVIGQPDVLYALKIEAGTVVVEVNIQMVLDVFIARFQKIIIVKAVGFIPAAQLLVSVEIADKTLLVGLVADDTVVGVVKNTAGISRIVIIE
jgi:hypothetical protein